MGRCRRRNRPCRPAKIPGCHARDSPRRGPACTPNARAGQSEEHTSELQSLRHLVCRLLLEKKKKERNQKFKKQHQNNQHATHNKQVHLYIYTPQMKRLTVHTETRAIVRIDVCTTITSSLHT